MVELNNAAVTIVFAFFGRRIFFIFRIRFKACFISRRGRRILCTSQRGGFAKAANLPFRFACSSHFLGSSHIYAARRLRFKSRHHLLFNLMCSKRTTMTTTTMAKITLFLVSAALTSLVVNAETKSYEFVLLPKVGEAYSPDCQNVQTQRRWLFLADRKSVV